MGKKFIQMGAVASISKSQDIYENWVKTGKNTGNLFIGYAVKTELNIEDTIMFHKVLDEHEVEYIKENYDALVIAASNFINPYSDFGVMADNLNRLKMPVITLGIGAQAESTNTSEITLKEGTKNFVYALSEYGNIIGVRGEFTAELLKRMGVKNCEVIGCPSYYINKNPKFKVNEKCYKSPDDIRVSYNFTNLYKEVDRKLMLTAYYTQSDIIGQTEYIEDYWKNNKNYMRHQLEDAQETVKLDWHRKKIMYQSLVDDFSKFKEYIYSHFYMFYDIPEWIAHIKKYDYVCGTRFHGCMLAIQNMIPALLITHDSRTSELADYCNIPCISSEQFLRYSSFEEILDAGLINYDKFNREYEAKFYNYISFLRKNGVDNVNELFALPKDHDH